MSTTPTELAERLYRARLDDATIVIEPPVSLAGAYAVQAAVDALDDGDPIGFKIGATIAPVIEAFALDRPFHGPLRERWCYRNGDRVPMPRAIGVRAETEVVVGLQDDLRLGVAEHSPRDVPRDRIERVAAAVGWVAPGIELVGTRIEGAGPGQGLSLIADSGANIAIVLGDAQSPPEDHDGIGGYAAALSINGETRAAGRASDSLAGHPFGMIAWLLGQPAFAERGLRAGEFVFCGTCTGALDVLPGDRLDADVGPLGRVSATLA